MRALAPEVRFSALGEGTLLLAYKHCRSLIAVSEAWLPRNVPPYPPLPQLSIAPSPISALFDPPPGRSLEFSPFYFTPLKAVPFMQTQNPHPDRPSSVLHSRLFGFGTKMGGYAYKLLDIVVLA
jgi:hypothetical protein